MSKTHNFSLGPKLTVFPLSLCLLVLCAHGAAAQQSKAIEPCSATPNGSPAARLKKASAAAGDAPDVRARVSETEINSTIPDDASVDKMLEPYVSKVRALDVVIGKLEDELRKAGMGGGSLGNFVADGMRAEANINLGQPVALVVTNSGGLRKNSIAPGELHPRDPFALLPFGNKVVERGMTCPQLLNVLKAG